jgi:hypothetical protein
MESSFGHAGDRPGSHSSEEAEAIIASLIASGEGIRARGIEELLDCLGRVGARFLDSEDPLAREALERIPEEAGYSIEMSREVLSGVAREWTRERLDTLVTADFPDRRVLDGFADAPGGGRTRALGGRFALHIAAGNVPGVGATSLLLSLLVKTPLLLKPGRGDRVLPELLLRGISEGDSDLAKSAAVVYWSHGEGGELEATALRSAERVVVYGGTEAIARLRERTPPSTPFVAYGPRISMGAVAREVLGSEDETRRTARDAARAVALFDRRGCVSPQILWVEEGGAIRPLAFAELLAGELERLDRELPPGPLDPATAAEIVHQRGMSELRRAGGSPQRVFAGEDGRWTLFFEPEEGTETLCGGRTVKVRPIHALEELATELIPFRGMLQTVALSAPPERGAALAEGLALEGLTRITTFADQPFPPAWWRHDGEGPLRALVRWVEFTPPPAAPTSR